MPKIETQEKINAETKRFEINVEKKDIKQKNTNFQVNQHQTMKQIKIMINLILVRVKEGKRLTLGIMLVTM